jgi:hypothetical protein
MTEAAKASARIVCADSLRHLRTLESDSIGAIITDPPYGLSATKPAQVTEAIARWSSGEREFIPEGRGFMSQRWDSFVPPPALWDECLRVLRPGGHLAVFAGSRTQDLMGVSIRLAGFETRDGLAFIFGSGMPHGQNVATAVAKTSEGESAWEGWSTALKPAQEPIILARKPLSEPSVARNVIAHGTGALNTGATRIAHRSAADLAESMEKNKHATFGSEPGRNNIYGDYSMVASKDYDGSQGRHPANVVLAHAAGCQQRGEKQVRSDSHHPASRPAGGIGSSGRSGQDGLVERSPGTETVPDWQCAPGCPVAEVDQQSGGGPRTGGASRFFLTAAHDPVEDETPVRYSAKAGAKERPTYVDAKGKTVRHVSVKPLRVMRWLVRLLTPAGGAVLDPFAGSGTTAEAALLEASTRSVSSANRDTFRSSSSGSHACARRLAVDAVERSGAKRSAEWKKLRSWPSIAG